jgi:hypothetical protein
MMKSKLLAAVAVAVAALNAPASASAAGNATVVNVAGEAAYTTFISESGEGDSCIKTTVGIVAAHEITQNVPGKPDLVTTAFIRLAQSTCNGTPLREYRGGSRELDKNTFQLLGQPRTANFTTTHFFLENYLAPQEEPGLFVNVNVTWTGEGAIGKNRNTNQNIEIAPDCKLTFQGTGVFRHAPALGSVVDVETGTNYTPGPSEDEFNPAEEEDPSQIGFFRSATLNIGACSGLQP